MTMDEHSESKEALGPPVQRPVGRLVPERETLADLIARMEREAFDRWLRDNGHCENQIDDMLMPLQRSLNELMWSAWKGRGALRVPCRGVTRDGCNYLAPCGSICNKCGHEH